MKRPEQQIQKAIVQHLHRRGMPGLVFWHTPQGAFYGSDAQGRIMKSLGVRPGVSDLILVYQNKIFALELKAEGGRATEAQLHFLQDIDRAGAFTALATGLDPALRTLEAWGLIKPAVTMRGIYNNLDSLEAAK